MADGNKTRSDMAGSSACSRWCPALISWAIIIGPIWLSFSYPWLVAYFVLSFDFYWLCRALWWAGAVLVAYRRVRDVLAADWPAAPGQPRGPRSAARHSCKTKLDARRRRAGVGVRGDPRGSLDDASARSAGSWTISTASAGRELPTARGAACIHPALIPTYTESLEKLRHTVRALAEAEWPRERKIVAIITRETDEGGIANVVALKEEFGDRVRRAHPHPRPARAGNRGRQEQRHGVGRALALSVAGSRTGDGSSKIIVTDLDADYRVHPQYFTYLTWMHRPIRTGDAALPADPVFHDDIWEAPLLLRLFAAVLTQMQMWRSVLPEKLQSFALYSTTLNMVHEVGYWATDAIPEDSRFYWKSYFTYGDRFRAVPAVHPDLRRRGARQDVLALAGHAVHAGAPLGVGRDRHPVRGAERDPPPRIPFWSRAWRVLNLFGEHINWAIAPFVIMFGATVPLLINPAFAETTLGQNLPLYASTMLSIGSSRSSCSSGSSTGSSRRVRRSGAGGRASCRTRNGSACHSWASSSATFRRSTPRRACSPAGTSSTGSPRRRRPMPSDRRRDRADPPRALMRRLLVCRRCSGSSARRIVAALLAVPQPLRLAGVMAGALAIVAGAWLALVPLTVRVQVEVGAIRISWIGGERVHALVRRR